MGWRFKGLWVDGFSADVINCANIWHVVRKPLWRMTRVVLRLDFISDRSVASSSVHFLYKYQGLPFSFLHFQLKHIVRVQPPSLSETTPFNLLHLSLTHILHSIATSVIDTHTSFNCYIFHRRTSFVHSQKLVSVLFPRVLQIYLLPSYFNLFS